MTEFNQMTEYIKYTVEYWVHSTPINLYEYLNNVLLFQCNGLFRSYGFSFFRSKGWIFGPMVSYLFGPLDSVYGHSLENSDYLRWNIKDESYQEYWTWEFVSTTITLLVGPFEYQTAIRTMARIPVRYSGHGLNSCPVIRLTICIDNWSSFFNYAANNAANCEKSRTDLHHCSELRMILQFCGLNCSFGNLVPKIATSQGITKVFIVSCTCCQLLINTIYPQ